MEVGFFLAQGGRVLEDWGGVCVTVAYESFDGSKEGCKRLRASANEIFFVYLRVTMSFSIFHFGQSLDIATWSPWQFTHFGSFWQSFKLCPSSPHPAQMALPLHEFLVCPNFWHWRHLWVLGMYGHVSFFRYPILILFGIVCPLMVKTYRLYRMEILLTAMIPCGWSSFFIYFPSILSSSSHLITTFDGFRVLCGETFTGK